MRLWIPGRADRLCVAGVGKLPENNPLEIQFNSRDFLNMHQLFVSSTIALFLPRNPSLQGTNPNATFSTIPLHNGTMAQLGAWPETPFTLPITSHISLLITQYRTRPHPPSKLVVITDIATISYDLEHAGSPFDVMPVYVMSTNTHIVGITYSPSRSAADEFLRGQFVLVLHAMVVETLADGAQEVLSARVLVDGRDAGGFDLVFF